MLEVVKDVHFARDRLGGDNLVHLGHVARTVDLTRVINLQLNLNALILRQVCTSLRGGCLPSGLGSCGNGTTSRGTCPLVWVVETFAVFPCVFRGLQRDLNFYYLHVVLLIV